jgi:HK97 gp10 family phage protein
MGIKIKDNSAAVLQAVKQQAEAALEEAGAQCEGYAKMDCPVDTERLRASISHVTQELVTHVGTDTFYGKYVELGTVNMRTQPYLKPALVNHFTEYKEIIESKFKRYKPRRTSVYIY